MMDLETIKSENAKAVRKARKDRKLPYIAACNADGGVFKCPRLGDYIPKGWKVINTYFVDSSGFGSEGESALTASQFQNKVKQGYGYAIQDAGQFQVYIREYSQGE